MYEVFAKLLNMSLTASILVLVILILRFVLKKAPKKYVCILWALVAFRLICPFSISSVFSAYNLLHQNTISSGQVEYFEYSGQAEKPQLMFEVPAIVHDNVVPESVTIGTKTSGVYMPTVVYIWMFGVIVMVAYTMVSYARLHKEVRASIKKNGNIYVCDEISSPFILGIIRPRIYLPSGISEEVSENVVAHEKAHIKRLDYIWKPFGFTLLSIYWFSPMMWIAYIFLCKDIEAACDEKVISKMDKEHIASYSQALLTCATQRRMITACPVAFGETDVKGRIKKVLNYRRPAFGIVCISVIVCIVVAICFLTNPKNDENVDELQIIDEPKLDEVEENEGSTTDITYELIFNFSGRYYLSDAYEEPIHGDYTPAGWYALGGEGECIDPYFSEREIFEDGKLIAYTWLDNHSECHKINSFTVGEYSCCLYQYSFDLFTVPELEKYPDAAPTSEYWVIFYTEGEGKALYIKYFNSDYFTQEQAIEKV